MYNAPAVSFPVGRSLFAAFGLVLIWAVGAMVCAWLAVMPSQPAWLPPAVVALCLTVGLAALSDWRNSPVGTLLWDRKQWAFTQSQVRTDAPMAFDDVSVHLDFQSVMLVSFRLPTGQRKWVWLENREHGRQSKRLWRVLRRAIYARPRDKDYGSGLKPKRVENFPA